MSDFDPTDLGSNYDDVDVVINTIICNCKIECLDTSGIAGAIRTKSFGKYANVDNESDVDSFQFNTCHQWSLLFAQSDTDELISFRQQTHQQWRNRDHDWSSTKNV